VFSRVARFSRPVFLRQGEIGKVALRLMPEDTEPPGGGVALETRLEVSGLPANDRTYQSVLLPQAAISFSWDVRANNPGTYEGKVWVWVGQGQDRQMILAAPFTLTCIRILGIPVWVLRWGGAGGFLLFGGLAGLLARRGFRPSNWQQG